MEGFTPYPPYNPEDEYAPIEQHPAQPEPQNPAAQEPVPQVEQPAEPQMTAQPIERQTAQPAPQFPEQPAAPYAQPVQQPAPQYPQYPQYQPYPQAPQNAQYQQPVPQYQQPAQPYQPYQQTAQQYPQQAPQQTAPQNTQYPQQAQQYPQPTPQPAQPYQPQGQPYQQRPAGNPYQQYPQQPYQQAPQQPAPKPPKTPTSTGTKVFIIVLIALLIAMIVGFGVYIANSTKSAKSAKNSNSDNPFNITIPKDNDSDSDSGSSPNGGINIDDFFSNNGNSGSYTEIEDEITLVEDNGETQNRDTDNKDSVGKPDEKAAALVLNALPADKDNAKYNTNSAYAAVSDSVVTVECFLDEITDNDRDIKSSGSGTIYSADGYIVTNSHVIGDSKTYLVRVVLNNGEKYPAKIVGYDTWTDLAVLKIEAKDLKPVSFGDSKLINVGDDVIAIGSPGGEKFQNSLTKGIVSAVDRELSINRYVRYIQSDAAISPGNSGGALCNIYGQVIGITTAKTVAAYYESMSFSIPSETVKEIVDDLMHYGYVKGRCRIGLMGTQISEEEIYYYGETPGIVIAEISKGGSLDGSKLKEGDILYELDGVEIASFQDVYDVLADHKPGDKVKIKAYRPGE